MTKFPDFRDNLREPTIAFCRATVNPSVEFKSLRGVRPAGAISMQPMVMVRQERANPQLCPKGTPREARYSEGFTGRDKAGALRRVNPSRIEVADRFGISMA